MDKVLVVDVSSLYGHFSSGMLKKSIDKEYVITHSTTRVLAYIHTVMKDYKCEQVWLIFEGHACAFKGKIPVHIEQKGQVIPPAEKTIKRVPKMLGKGWRYLLSILRAKDIHIERYMFMSADDIIKRVLKDSQYEHAYVLSADKDMKRIINSDSTFLKVRPEPLGILKYNRKSL
jgi:hypothetical protein